MKEPQNEKEIQKELEALSPLLANLRRKQSPPSLPTPSFYFEELEDKVLAQLEGRPLHRRRVQLGFWQRKSWRYATAALLGLGLVSGLWYANSRKSPELALQQLDTQEVKAYLSQNLEDYEAEELVNLLSEEDFRQLQAEILLQVSTDETLLEDLSTDEILETL